MKAISLAQSLVLKSKQKTRKKYSKIYYKNACGDEVSIAGLADMYGVSEKTITRAFSEFNGDYEKANYNLIERNLVPGCDLEPGIYMRKDYRDQEGNRISRKKCAEIMGLNPDYLRSLYWKYKSDWKYIYDNYGATRKVVQKRGSGNMINYRDADSSASSLGELMDRYGVSEKTVMRAFVKHDHNPWFANEYLCERHLVEKQQRAPSDNYNFKDYRNLQGVEITRKDAAAIMQLSPKYVSHLYDKYDNDWRFIHDNFGKNKIISK